MKIRDNCYQYYFYFLQERMDIFWKRYENKNYPFSNDFIFINYKFTNVYRSTDRVSQYLIRNVIYNERNSWLNEEDILLRILLFKIFNKIETWEYLEEKFGMITFRNFNPDKISKCLSERILKQPIFNSAYMMTGTHHEYSQFGSKHEKWLNMLNNEFIRNKKLKKVIKAKSLEEIYNILRSCAFLGDFLSYQYTIDMNYSNIIDFDENSFVKAGIGSIRGIKKCFSDLQGYTYEDAIRYTLDNLNIYQEKYGFNKFRNLFGREPKLIDLQNCFCETDKYLRAKMPELRIDNVRIKQKFRRPKALLHLFFPPKWNINSNCQRLCSTKNMRELILF